MSTLKHLPLGSTNTRGLAHVNLMQNILSRVLAGPRKLNHLLLEISLDCLTFTCSDTLEVCFPWLPHHLWRITSPFTLPFISDKGKRELWKLLSEKESCLSDIVSCKSREVHLQALFYLIQTRNMNFSLLPSGLESYARVPPTPPRALRIPKTQAHVSGLTTAVLHSTATSCMVVPARPSTPPELSFWRWRPFPKKLPETFPPRCPTSHTCRFTLLFAYLVTLFKCLVAIQIYGRLTLLTLRQSLEQSEIKYMVKTPAETFNRPCSKLCVLIS